MKINYICTRCHFVTNHKLLFEIHLILKRHNYLFWRKNEDAFLQIYTFKALKMYAKKAILIEFWKENTEIQNIEN